MYGVAAGQLAPEERLLFLELLTATIKPFNKDIQFFVM
jgi:hypothetical protein